jgi:hypothetical protein
MSPRLVGSVSSSVCGFDAVKAFVLFPHESCDDQREQEYKRHHDDQLKHQIHVRRITTVWCFGWRAFGTLPAAFGHHWRLKPKP